MGILSFIYRKDFEMFNYLVWRAICWIIRNLPVQRYICDHQVERFCECRRTRLLKREEVKEWPALTFRRWHIGYCRTIYYVLLVYQIQCLDTISDSFSLLTVKNQLVVVAFCVREKHVYETTFKIFTTCFDSSDYHLICSMLKEIELKKCNK